MAPAQPCTRTAVAALATALLAGCFAAQAQSPSVNLSGMLGSKALLVVGGAEPKVVAPGESHRGVRVLSTQGDSAVLEIAGQRHTLRVGDSPVSVGKPINPGSGGRIVLSADSGGHFVTQGLLNSKPAQFMIDTGASTIGISAADAERVGIKYKEGQQIQVSTANGVVAGWRVRLVSVRLNDVEIRDIDAVVTPVTMPFVLLGNSFLTRFQMTRNNEQMVLERRY